MTANGRWDLIRRLEVNVLYVLKPTSSPFDIWIQWVIFYFDNAHIVNSLLFFYMGNISTCLLHEGYFLMVGNWGTVVCEEFL